MLAAKDSSEKIINKGLFFPTLRLSGPEQMAADVILLEKAIEGSGVSLLVRFYNWKGLWLSIGKNQRYLPLRWKELVKEGIINIVRRPSGGSAVLHGAGLTYSLVWISPPRKKRQAYYLANQWLINGFSNLGLSLEFGDQSTNQFEKNCFATSTTADLVDLNGCKRIGSAQLWRKGHLLQHGEILLDPPPKLWMQVFNTKAPRPVPTSIPRNGLDQILLNACQNYWEGVNWQPGKLTKDELERVSIEAHNYSLRVN